MVNFDTLSHLDEAQCQNGGILNQSREQAAPALRPEEERAIFTFTKNPPNPSAEHAVWYTRC